MHVIEIYMHVYYIHVIESYISKVNCTHRMSESINQRTRQS